LKPGFRHAQRKPDKSASFFTKDKSRGNKYLMVVQQEIHKLFHRLNAFRHFGPYKQSLLICAVGTLKQI
jgi:hypothetical protein